MYQNAFVWGYLPLDKDFHQFRLSEISSVEATSAVFDVPPQACFHSQLESVLTAISPGLLSMPVAFGRGFYTLNGVK